MVTASERHTEDYIAGRPGSDRPIVVDRRMVEPEATGTTARRTPLAVEGALNREGHHARCAQATAWHGTDCACAFHRLLDQTEAEGRTEIAEELRAYHAAGVLR